MYLVHICWVDADHRLLKEQEYWSTDIPDLCSLADALDTPFEITVYEGKPEEMWITEQYDEPGEKGNYGGFWHHMNPDGTYSPHPAMWKE
jgi:hypothetical protein